ncbi:MAG TPA: hypothetical protein PKC39_04545 [Ferruginibacter sp.]|mgnify:CR=1 FL=1|nr:hypothetical protein [Ferruginibacter sp.]HMP20209.1 hypothetical protein [Ferruginibacter sp.]
MFLKKVYTTWPALFWGILIFIGAQAFFMYKGIQTIPFFIYSMFSTPHPVQDSVEVVLIKTENGYISPFNFSNREAEMLLNNVPYYSLLKQQGSDITLPTVESRFKNRLSPPLYQRVLQALVNDSAAVNRYPQWWAKYFTSVQAVNRGTVQLVKSYMLYQPALHKSPKDSVIFSVQLNP